MSLEKIYETNNNTLSMWFKVILLNELEKLGIKVRCKIVCYKMKYDSRLGYNNCVEDGYEIYNNYGEKLVEIHRIERYDGNICVEKRSWILVNSKYLSILKPIIEKALEIYNSL